MSSFVIEGGYRLSGEIVPQGAKNEALQVICATLLTPEKVTIHNVPDILDVNNLIQLLRDMQVKVEHPAADTYTFQADAVDLNYLETDEFLRKSGSLRGSVMIVGPLVARFGKALIPKPGGDKIGRRRLDTHFVGIQKLGACFSYDPDRQLYEIEAKKLKGAYMLLDEASVTGTANILMAAVLAEGKTTIYNAACEPYLQQLSSMLNRMGARISGVGSNLLTIEGVEALGGTTHTILPDMIEVGSFIGMAAMTGSDITIKNTGYDMLGIIPDSFRRLGITVEQIGDDIHVPTHDSYQIETFYRRLYYDDCRCSLAGTDAGLAECLPRCGDAGCRQCADPSEDVRKPSLLCRQTDRHGSADHSLRSAQGDCDWVGQSFQTAWFQYGFSGYSCRHCFADCGDECRRYQPYP